MPRWWVSEPFITLWLQDEPLGYQPATGPRISLLLTYKQREETSGAFPGPSYDTRTFGFGKAWNNQWLSYVTTTPGYNSFSLGAALFYPGGGSVIVSDFYNPSSVVPLSNSRLVALTNSGGTILGFEHFHSDGRKDVYGQMFTLASGKPMAMLTERWNVAGQKTTLTYHSLVNDAIRLKEVIDGDGRKTTVSYVTSNSFSTNLISQITDPFGRSATFAYDSQGLLTNILDVASLTSSFSYDQSVYSGYGLAWVTNMVTPYGTTSFDYFNYNVPGDVHLVNGNIISRAVTVTEPNGGKQLFLYRSDSSDLPNCIASSYPTSMVPTTAPNYGNTFENSDLTSRNSYHWGPRQYANLSSTFLSTRNLSVLSTNDYLKARMRHWLSISSGYVSTSLSLERSPSPDGSIPGQLTWYDYAGKPAADTIGTQILPLFTAQVLPDGTTRYTRTERSDWGKVLNEISTYTSGSSVALRTTQYIYDTGNKVDLIKVINPSSVTVLSNAYNSFHQITKSYNALSEYTLYAYDDRQRLTNIVYPNGLNTIYRYYTNAGTNLHNLGFAREIVDVGLRTNSFAYSNGLVSVKTDELTLVVTNTYDSLQRLTGISYPDGTYISNIYSRLDLVATWDRLGKSNLFEYNAVRQLIHLTNALQKVTTYNYCSCGALDSIQDALANTTYFSYDLVGRMTNMTYPGGTFVSHAYNALGQLVNSADSLGTSTNYYNNQGLHVARADGSGQLFRKVFDIEDRISSQTGPDSVTVALTYDNLNRIKTRTYPDAGVESFIYAPNERFAQVYTSQISTNVSYYRYDAMDRVTSMVQTNYSTNTFGYDASGNMLAMTNGSGKFTKWEYDVFGLLRTKRNALGNVDFTYSYFPTGWLSNRVDALNQETKYTYDAAGNLKTIDYVSLGASPDISYAYDAVNRMTNMVDQIGTTGWSYTGFGKVVNEAGPWADMLVTMGYNNSRLRNGMVVKQSGTPDWTTTYDYDSARRLTNVTSPAGVFGYEFAVPTGNGTTPGTRFSKIILPSNLTVTDTFDTVARLATTRLKIGSTELNSHSYVNDAAGRRKQQTWMNGNYVLYGYDTAGQLVSATGLESGGVTNRIQEQQSWGFDPVGNLSGRTNNVFKQAFTTNSLNQITGASSTSTYTVAGMASVAPVSATINTVTAQVYRDNTFAASGFSLASGNNTFQVIGQDALGRKDTNSLTVYLPSTVTYTYDACGNLKSDGTRTFTYDAEQQLNRVEVTGSWRTDFAYDGLRRRRMTLEQVWFNGTWVTNNYVRYLYDGNLVAREIWAGDEVNQHVSYTRGADLSGEVNGAGGIRGLLARTEKISGTARHQFYHADGAGNVTALVNTSGQVTARYQYDPFGGLLGAAGPMADANLYRYSSKEAHDKSGLYYFGYRFYEPNLQRLLNPDPIGEQGGINLYQFVYNNPNSWVDPYGLAVYPPGFTGPIQPGDSITPMPPSNIPGGPWTWSPNPQNPRGGAFLGPKPPGAGARRPICTWAPPGSVGGKNDPYWKTTDTDGNKQRYDQNGKPITPDQAHPGPNNSTANPDIAPIVIEPVTPVPIRLPPVRMPFPIRIPFPVLP